MLLRYILSLLFHVCSPDMMTSFSYSPKIQDARHKILGQQGIPDPGCNFLQLCKPESSFFNSQIAQHFSYSDPALRSLHESFEKYIFSLLHQEPVSAPVDCLIMMSLDSLFAEFLYLHYPEKINSLGTVHGNRTQNYPKPGPNSNKYHN